ncbi:MAG TPA: flagellar biosynthesis protein FlhF, partial [Gammaproteobacteria bacterium]|nr:flagellar biosynthesis protein FlhF [Gammaproteobacteria bacterium]
DGDLVEQGGVVALVGPTGVGKTTTLAKLTARAVLKTSSGQVALITTDNYRVGAHEQLRTFGHLLGVPVRVAGNAADLDRLLKKLADKHLILIDTAGVSQRDCRLVKHLHTLDIKKSIRSFLVLSAATETAGLEEIIWQFQQVGLSGCILTKLDEAVLMGGVISAVLEHGLPIACVTDGQRVPEDLKIAKPHTLISRTIAMALKYQQHRQARIPYVGTGAVDRVAMAMAFGRN